MKTFISILTLALACLFSPPNLHAQNDTEYVIVDYMKVKPGMWDKYLECEQVWKLVHQNRVKQGLIKGWQLEQVVMPAGTGTEYDFLTITHYKNWKAMSPDANWYDAAMKTLPADKRELAESANLYRDLVKSEVWTAGDRVFAPGATKPKYSVENFMSIPAAGWEDWVEMETKFAKPVHEKNIALGKRAGWLISYMAMPRGAGYSYQGSTVDYYNAWEDLDNDEGAAWETVYPDMSDGYIGRRIESVRTVVKTEVRMLVDSVE